MLLLLYLETLLKVTKVIHVLQAACADSAECDFISKCLLQHIATCTDDIVLDKTVCMHLYHDHIYTVYIVELL